MKRIWRILVSLFVGLCAGKFGALAVMIFGPLIFLDRLDGPPEGENILIAAWILVFVVSASLGFFLTWRLVNLGESERAQGEKITSLKID